MSHSHRVQRLAFGVIGALILTALFLWFWQSYRKYQNEHTQQRESIASYEADNGEKYADVCLKEGVTIIEVAKCLIKSVDANREAQRSQYDLQAQQEMAEWAFAVVLFSAGTFLTSLIGVFLVWTTFNATKEGNEITRKIGEAQVRAYLTFVGKDGRYMVRDDWFLVEIPISNSGQSPAVPLKIDSFFSFRIPPDSNKEENTVTSTTFWERITKGWGAETVRVASGERDLIVSFDEVNLFGQLGTVDQTNAILNFIRNGESQFEMFCRADWQDVFEVWHTLYLHYISTKAVRQAATADHKEIVKGGLSLMSETTYRPQSWPNHP